MLELGKQVAVLLDSTGASRKTMMVNGFYRGLAQGFGAVIGGSILVGLLLWLLSLLNEIPLLGPVFDVVTDTVQNR